MAKRTLVLVRGAPLNSSRTEEGLRQAVGLFIGDHEVTVVLADAAVLATLPPRPSDASAPQLQYHLETLVALGYPVWAEAESLARFGLAPSDLPHGIAAMPRAQLDAALADAEVVITW